MQLHSRAQRTLPKVNTCYRRAATYLISSVLLALLAALSAAAQSFAPAVSYTVDSGPQALVMADFNRDGKLDVATANTGNATNGSVSVLLGNGNGTFQAAVNYPTGLQASAIATGDVNHDGFLDLVVADMDLSHNEEYSVLLGNGDGTFRPKISSPPSGTGSALALADFNGDGRADLLRAFPDTGGISLLLSNGDGTFGPQGDFYRLAPGGAPRAIVIRDFNQDGIPDVAAAVEGSNATGLAVLLGNGNGTLKQPVYYNAATDFLAQLTAGDVNGDGKIDLIATSRFSGGRISVLLGNGDGTFQPRIDTSSNGTDKLSGADIDGDGKFDVLGLAGGGTLFPGSVAVLISHGDGTLEPARNFGFNNSSADLAVGDLNGDGKPDVVVAHGTTDLIEVLINQTGPLSIKGIVTDQSGAALPGVTVALSGSTNFVNTLTNGGGSYSFAGLPQGGNYTVTPSRQNYAFAPPQQTFNNLNADEAANFNATLLNYTISGTITDGSLAGVGGVTVTLTGSTITPRVTTTDSNGRYSFTGVPGGINYSVTPTLARHVFAPGTASFINLSSDRTINFGIALATYSIGLALHDPNVSQSALSATFRLSGTVSGNNFSNLPAGGNYTVTVSQTDLPFTNFILLPPFSQTFNDLSANQIATFNAKLLNFSAGPAPHGVATGDFNGDGKLDVVATNWGNNQITLLLGNGDGTFQTGNSYAVGGTPVLPVVADFNGDGKPDIAVANFGMRFVSVLLGNGDGTFQPNVYYDAGGSGLSWLTTADLNGDGKVDLLVADSDTSSVSVLLGNGDGTFQKGIAYAVSSQPRYVTTGDLNGDGKLDVVAGNTVLMGNGDGTLGSAKPFISNANPPGAVVADFNGDGKLDLAVTGFSLAVGIYLGNGDGTFQPLVTYPILADTGSVRAVDLNADGKLDLVMASSSFGVAVLMGNGDGTFQDYTLNLSNGLNPFTVEVGDFNNDGRPDLTFANASNLGVASGLVSVLLNQMGSALQFTATSYTANEGDGRAVITVARSGDLSRAATVSYNTQDPSDPPVPCNVVTGLAYPRCDYATSVDTLTFAPGERTKNIIIPLIDDAYVEGNETFVLALHDATGGILSGKRFVTITIKDNDSVPAANPVFNTDFFVRQHYLDFLSREPDTSGFNAWTNLLNNCSDVNNNPQCDRLTVSQSFFQSQEFQLKGFYVFRFYVVSLFRQPSYNEIITDMRSVTGQTAAEVFAKRAAFADNWVKRYDFSLFYNGRENQTFVGMLLNNYNLAQITTPDPQQPDGPVKVTLTRADLTHALDAGTLTRAQVVRAVADSDEVSAAEFNRAFVAMQYFGYLRRTPETTGYNNWLNYLNDHPGDYRTMVNGFVNSTEYKLRFGNPNQ